MAEVSTDSYLKPAALPVQKSALDQMQQYGALEQQQQAIQSNAIGIDKQKLDLVNERFRAIAPQMAALANKPDLTPQDVSNTLLRQRQAGLIDDKTYQQEIAELPKDPAKLKPYIEDKLLRGKDTIDAINFHYGQPGMMDTGNANQPVTTSPKFGTQSTGLPVARQASPSQVQYGPNGQASYRGVQPPETAPGMVAAPPAKPGIAGAVAPQEPEFIPLPTARPTDKMPATLNERMAAAGPAMAQRQPAMAAPSPLFEEGKKMLTEDQTLAAAKMQAAKPAIQALKLMPGLRTGPGTQQFNDLTALAKAWGVVNTQAEKDPTVLRQEVEKKLAQYVSGSPIAARSDAAQTLAEAASPNPKKQLLPALMALTRDAVVLDRVQAARALAFKNEDLSKYGNHRATFPQSIDERAFGLDLMEPKERDDLVRKMAAKYKNSPNDKEANKFLNSLQLAKEQGFFDGSE